MGVDSFTPHASFGGHAVSLTRTVRILVCNPSSIQDIIFKEHAVSLAHPQLRYIEETLLHASG